MIRENLKKEIKMFVEMLHQRAREEGRYNIIIIIVIQLFIYSMNNRIRPLARKLVNENFKQEQCWCELVCVISNMKDCVLTTFPNTNRRRVLKI